MLATKLFVARKPPGFTETTYHGRSGGALRPARPTSGGQKTERLRVIDWEQPAHNDFLLVSQFSVTGALYTCRPDLIGFVNGLPLVVIELKKPGVQARGVRREPDALQAADPGPVLVQRAAHRLERHGQPRRLAHGGLGAVLRGPSRTGGQRIEREDEPRRVSLEVMLRGTCDRTRLLSGLVALPVGDRAWN
jgi:type I restriction enzyme, R subunit